MIAIIDYGCGNLFSLSSSLKSLGIECKITSDKDEIRAAERINHPGVGAFGDAAKKLRNCGMDKLICELAAEGKPILGICLGMQLLFERALNTVLTWVSDLSKATSVLLKDRFPQI